MPHSRPMPEIGRRCHELRIVDGEHTWRIIYRADPDAIVIAEVFGKKRARPRPTSSSAASSDCERTTKRRVYGGKDETTEESAAAIRRVESRFCQRVPWTDRSGGSGCRGEARACKGVAGSESSAEDDAGGSGALARVEPVPGRKDGSRRPIGQHRPAGARAFQAGWQSTRSRAASGGADEAARGLKPRVFEAVRGKEQANASAWPSKGVDCASGARVAPIRPPAATLPRLTQGDRRRAAAPATAAHPPGPAPSTG